MKHLYTLLALFLVTAFSSCSDDSKFGISTDVEPTQTKAFATDDGATDLTKRSEGYIAYKLLKDAGTSVANSLGYLNITDAQYAEIKQFTRGLVAGCTNDAQKHDVIFNWITKNIKYEWGDNDPYAVFINKKGICQGYANLLKVMLHSQNVPCVIVNGMLNPIGGHAWNYVYYDNKWYVSDPTNNVIYSSGSYNSYSQYAPTSIDAVLFEDDYCTYNYYEGHLNVQSIKAGNESFSIPYSAGGYKISMFNPSIKAPEGVKEIYVGSNIQSFGENIIGLSKYAPSVENIYIDPENEFFESYSAGVYDKNKTGDNLVLIAPATKHLELKPIVSFDKESKLRNLPFLETLTFVPGTRKIGAWAVENCPNLHLVYAPAETNIDSGAFSGVASDFFIVRGNFTNIPQIKY